MTEKMLSAIAYYFVISSILAFLFIICVSFFLDRWLPSSHSEKRLFAWFGITLLTLVIFIATLYLSFGIGGCFKSCSGKIDNEMDAIIGGIVNWLYVFILFSVCLDNKTHTTDCGAMQTKELDRNESRLLP